MENYRTVTSFTLYTYAYPFPVMRLRPHFDTMEEIST